MASSLLVASMPSRRRTCPSCKHTQSVSVLLRDAKVTCRRCGSVIPSSPAVSTAAPPKPKRRP